MGPSQRSSPLGFVCHCCSPFDRRMLGAVIVTCGGSCYILFPFTYLSYSHTHTHACTHPPTHTHTHTHTHTLQVTSRCMLSGTTLSCCSLCQAPDCGWPFTTTSVWTPRYGRTHMDLLSCEVRESRSGGALGAQERMLHDDCLYVRSNRPVHLVMCAGKRGHLQSVQNSPSA